MGLLFRKDVGIHHGKEGTNPECEAGPMVRKLADQVPSARKMLAF